MKCANIMAIRKTHSKSTRLTTYIKRHPKESIEELLNVAIYQLYGLEIIAKLTRQNKTILADTHKNIDYAYPCFELANTIDEIPAKTSKEVARQAATLIKKYTDFQENVKIESLNGYVNFTLSNDYIAQAAYFTAHWLQKPQGRLPKKMTARFLISGPAAGHKTNKHPAELTYRLLRSMYKIAGYSVESRYILTDTSETAAETLTMHIALERGEIKKSSSKPHAFLRIKQKNLKIAQLERSIKHELSGLTPLTGNKQLAKILSLKKKELLNDLQEYTKNYKIKAKPELETNLRKPVNSWVEKFALSSKIGSVIHDPSSQAVYLELKTSLPVSLRSARGILFRNAYLLYLTDWLLQRARKLKGSQDPVILLVPRKFHQLLYAYSDMLIPNSAYNNVICLDPEQIYRIFSSDGHMSKALEDIFKLVAHRLGSAIGTQAHLTLHKRQLLLQLIDFPLDFNDLLKQIRPLELIALLNAIETTAAKI